MHAPSSQLAMRGGTKCVGTNCPRATPRFSGAREAEQANESIHAMETILVKIFATALALSQVTTTPDAVKTQFDRTRDQEQVVQLLRAGCTHMRKAFDIEDINLDDLIAAGLDDPQAVAGENKLFRGIDFADLQTAYRQFCTNEEVPVPAVDLADVIDFYNKAAA